MHFCWLSFWDKGYKVLNIKTNDIFVLGNVKFVEDIFPLHNGHLMNTYGSSIMHVCDDSDPHTQIPHQEFIPKQCFTK